MNTTSPLIIRTFAAIAAAFLMGSLCGCGQQPASSAQNQTLATAAGVNTQALNITFATVPDPPHSGDNAVEVTLKQSDGTQITDATVSAIFRMPAMPSMNMPEMHSAVTLTHQQDGRYRGSGSLEMSGTWNVTVNVSRGGEKVAAGKFTVIAK